MSNKEQSLKIVDLLRAAILRDEELRQKHGIGSKFRFVQDRLKALLDELESENSAALVEQEKDRFSLREDEMVVFVYLYNSEGVTLRNWQKMLTPALFYEYSVNRPIYVEVKHIETLLRSKANKMQHAYLSILIKKTDRLTEIGQAKDVMDNPIIKVREGCLRFEKLISFTHNGIDYLLNEEGEIVKK